jgi:hypothetical protein
VAVPWPAATAAARWVFAPLVLDLKLGSVTGLLLLLLSGLERERSRRIRLRGAGAGGGALSS